MSAAVSRDRAIVTGGIDGVANECTEFHEGLVPITWPSRIDQFRGDLRQLRRLQLRRFPVGPTKPPRQNPAHVRIHSRHIFPQCDAGDSSRGIGSHAGHLEPFVPRPGQPTATFRHDETCRLVQQTRPPVISQSRPELQDFLFRSGSQGENVREASVKSTPVRDHRFDCRLLQHDFRNPDAKQIGMLTPG
jgi:hypothetical protein